MSASFHTTAADRRASSRTLNCTSPTGPLEGLKLIGFTVWEGRTPSKLNVTFPARQYSVNGERRSFSLLRALSEPAAIERLRQVILDAYAEHQRMAVAS